MFYVSTKMFNICFSWWADRPSVLRGLRLTQSHKSVWMSYMQRGRKPLHIKHKESQGHTSASHWREMRRTELCSESRPPTPLQVTCLLFITPPSSFWVHLFCLWLFLFVFFCLFFKDNTVLFFQTWRKNASLALKRFHNLFWMRSNNWRSKVETNIRVGKLSVRVSALADAYSLESGWNT